MSAGAPHDDADTPAAAEPGSRVRASVSEPAGGDLPEALDTSAAADTPGDGGDGSDQPSVTPAELSELGGGSPPGPAAGLDLLRDVELTVTVEVGRARTRVRDLLGLREGSVVELDRQVGSPVDLLVNGRVIARGEIVLVADQLGVRVTGLRPEGDDG